MHRVKAGIFSLTPPAPPDDDGSYLRWHLLDHMPEQFQLSGILHGSRWIADGPYLTNRIATSGPLDQVGGVVNYLVSEPVQQTIDEFIDLGRRLREIGRFPEVRPSLQVCALALQRSYAAPRVLVSAEVLPWRPHRGVLLIVEQPASGPDPTWLQWLHAEHHPAVLQEAGVAGVWMYGSTGSWIQPARFADGPQYVTVVYLDGDPLDVTSALAPLIEARWASGAVRPMFAGPLRSMITWESWPDPLSGR